MGHDAHHEACSRNLRSIRRAFTASTSFVLAPRAAGADPPLQPRRSWAAIGEQGASRAIDTVLEPNTVPEPRLVGYWTDKYLYTGDMDSAGIAFRADGTGWVYWCAAAAFEILLFTWHTAADNHLSINLDEQVSGTWHQHGQTVTQLAHDPGPPRRSDRHDLHDRGRPR